MRRRFSGDFDTTLFIAAVALIICGIFFLYSATYSQSDAPGKNLFLKQLFWAVIGLISLFLITQIDYQRIIDFAYPLYAINIAMLVVLMFIGRSRLGAQRWFEIGDFTVQPSEFIKVTLVVALATSIGSRKTLMDNLTSLIVPILLIGVPFALIIMQPDLGTALLLAPLAFTMFYIGGARLKHLITMLLMGLVGVPFFWQFLRDYQKDRLLVFLDPNIDPLGAGYTIIQSKIAIGSGGMFGKGWLSGTQSQFNFLTERHTDFIFSVVGEEWGFIGASVVIALYLVIIARAFAILNSTNDIYGRLIASGAIALFTVQVFVNIGMTIGLMPVVGLPLPLISYGGSSMVATLMLIGLLLNVGMRRSMF